MWLTRWVMSSSPCYAVVVVDTLERSRAFERAGFNAEQAEIVVRTVLVGPYAASVLGLYEGCVSGV